MKIKNILAFMLLLSLVALPALGQDVRPTELHERAEQMRAEREAQAEEFRQRQAELEAQRQQRLEQRQIMVAETVEERAATQRAENFANRINQVNGNMTDAYLRHLDKMEMVLDKIVSRANKFADEHGIDIGGVESQARVAQAQIDSARESVLAQKAKVYTATVESTEQLGVALRGLLEELHSDHRALREELRLARQSVQNVFQELRNAMTFFRQSQGGDDE